MSETPAEAPADAPVDAEPVYPDDAADTDADKCPVCGLLTDNRCSHT